jgi:hypothetical protein
MFVEVEEESAAGGGDHPPLLSRGGNDEIYYHQQISPKETTQSINSRKKSARENHQRLKENVRQGQDEKWDRAGLERFFFSRGSGAPL